ncbi:hypothetical protein [Fuscovulum ytuae]|uniref:Uncharacterized protein n=1 Tax=Fuscovulum ytuae TaxID=3042299 RepID=A0ABY8Q9S7_9RHOB|nr:hypothetical protein [Fuscovulum sp. YMD61]WGV16967.1 hypothetical protein QF092_03930 [Fuscovulum sp. YMD61]
MLTYAQAVAGVHQRGRIGGMGGLPEAAESGYRHLSATQKMEGVMVNIAGSSRRGGIFGLRGFARYGRG